MTRPPRDYLVCYDIRDPARLTAMRQHIRKVIEAKIAAGDKNLTLLDGLSLLGPADLDGLVEAIELAASLVLRRRALQGRVL